MQCSTQKTDPLACWPTQLPSQPGSNALSQHHYMYPWAVGMNEGASPPEPDVITEWGPQHGATMAATWASGLAGRQWAKGSGAPCNMQAPGGAARCEAAWSSPRTCTQNPCLSTRPHDSEEQQDIWEESRWLPSIYGVSESRPLEQDQWLTAVGIYICIVMSLRAAIVDIKHVIAKQDQQGGLQQPRARTLTHPHSPTRAVWPHSLPGSGHRGIQLGKKRFIVWIRPPWKISIVHADPGDHLGIWPWSAVQGCVEVRSLHNYSWSYSNWQPRWCSCPELPSKAIQTFLDWVTAWGHPNVLGPWCHQGL